MLVIFKTYKKFPSLFHHLEQCCQHTLFCICLYVVRCVGILQLLQWWVRIYMQAAPLWSSSPALSLLKEDCLCQSFLAFLSACYSSIVLPLPICWYLCSFITGTLSSLHLCLSKQCCSFMLSWLPMGWKHFCFLSK